MDPRDDVIAIARADAVALFRDVATMVDAAPDDIAADLLLRLGHVLLALDRER